MNDIAIKVDKIYYDHFASEPAMYYSPGRINLIGEHIDYNDGFVMPAAISKGIFFAIAKNDSDEINFFSVDFDEWLTLNVSEVRKMDGWKNYVLSVVNEFKVAGKEIGGFDCVFGGDIPNGAGMSSSAAVEGGLAVGLNDIFECGFTRTELALLCQRAEHNYPGVKCGIMDQYANMNGKKDHVILLDCMKLQHEYFPIEMEGYTIVLIDSKAEHDLGDSEYNKRREECERALALLNAKSFRELRLSDLEARKGDMDENVYDTAKYVIEEIQRTQKAAAYLKEGKVKKLGELMFLTHEGLRDLYHVSSDQLDFLVKQARKSDDVIGSRLMGAGFGGCTINIVKTDGVEKFIEKTLSAYKKEFGIEAAAYQVEITDGVSQIYLGG
jgi:galactokinase